MIKWLLIAVLIGVVLLAWRMAAFAKRNLPKVGGKIPDFSLPDHNGKTRQATEFLGKWLVLYFYPRDDTPGCVEEAAQFRDAMRDFEGLGAAVCGISVDDSASHAAFARKYNLPFPLLADRNGETAARFGSLINLGLLKFCRRNTFLVDPKGNVAKLYLGVNPARHTRQVMGDLSNFVKGQGCEKPWFVDRDSF